MRREGGGAVRRGQRGVSKGRVVGLVRPRQANGTDTAEMRKVGRGGGVEDAGWGRASYRPGGVR